MLSLLFNTLSRLVIAFLPRISHRLISWLHSPYAGDPGLIPGLRRSPGEGKGNPLQYSCLENPMDRGTWQATVHGVAKSQTWQNNWTSLQSPYAVILKPKKRKSVTASASYPFYLPWSDGTGCRDFRFLILRFKPALSLSSFTFIRRLFRSSLLSPMRISISEVVGISPGKLDSSL